MDAKQLKQNYELAKTTYNLLKQIEQDDDTISKAKMDMEKAEREYNESIKNDKPIENVKIVKPKKEVKEEKQDDSVSKPKRGRPKKLDLSNLTEEEVLQAIENENTHREEMKAEAYKRKLEARKEKRKAIGKKLGRPKIEKEEKPKPTPKPKVFKEFSPHDVRRNYQMYKSRILDIRHNEIIYGNDDDLKLYNLTFTQFIMNNSQLHEKDIETAYTLCKQKYPAMMSYTLFLDSIVFALYIHSQMIGERLTNATDERKTRTDDKEPKQEYGIYLEQDYDISHVGYWTKMLYDVVITGKWNIIKEKL